MSDYHQPSVVAVRSSHVPATCPIYCINHDSCTLLSTYLTYVPFIEHACLSRSLGVAASSFPFPMNHHGGSLAVLSTAREASNRSM